MNIAFIAYPPMFSLLEMNMIIYQKAKSGIAATHIQDSEYINHVKSNVTNNIDRDVRTPAIIKESKCFIFRN